MKLPILISAVCIAATAAPEPIWWKCDGHVHAGLLRDDTGAPVGKLLTDNAHWYGPAIFTGCTYAYDEEPAHKDVTRILPNRFIRGKDDPPPEPLFGLRLTDGRTGGDWSVPVGAKVGRPVKATFDFKRPCSFTEVDFMGEVAAGRTKPYSGFVSFSDDGRNWDEPFPFEGTQDVARVILPEPRKGRYMRFEFGLREKDKGARQFLDEVVAWGDGEVSEEYPEAGGPCDAPLKVPQSLRGIPDTAMSEEVFNEWSARVGGDVVVVPTRLHDPQRYSPITNSPPERYRISMTRREKETRYFAVANAGGGRAMARIAPPDFGPDVKAEIWLGAIIHSQHPSRDLTPAQKQALLLLELDPPSDIGPIEKMTIEPFVRGDMKPYPNFIRRYCGNYGQLLGFPGEFPLERGEAAVFMLRLETAGAAPGTRKATLSAGRGRPLEIELAIADAELDDSELIVQIWGPFIGQFPYEGESRRMLDIAFLNELGMKFAGGGRHFPKKDDKLGRWFDSTPGSFIRRKLLPGGNKYFPISKTGVDGLPTDADIACVVTNLASIKEEAARMGYPGDRFVLDFPDEPGPARAAPLLRIARAVKDADPDILLYANPCFFSEQTLTNDVLMAAIRSNYVDCIDFSVPSFLAARRDNVRREFFTSRHRDNGMYAHPARRMGRHGAWDAAVWGFNGFGYYTYWEPAAHSQAWDWRTSIASILGATYRMAYPSGEGFAITPLYEMMREAKDDFHLVKTLLARGENDLVRELHGISSRLRLKADFDDLHERLMAPLFNGTAARQDAPPPPDPAP